ncbi:hypothetical protein [Idiomarina sp.]|uniref:hypothetical protein n=1 Tax=Idiomarina sp. TaxID=1874361 RepID=UPI00262F5415|nr:hypothetical protein [Idiomarina sp.]
MKIVPIGAWCRTAFQVNEFKESNGIAPKAYPFDWTITPFLALEKSLIPFFNPGNVLQRASINKFGSVTCEDTHILFHHALSNNVVRKELSEPKEGKLSGDFLQSEAVSNAIGRFMHTYNNFSLLRAAGDSERVLFVRWQRSGHPDKGLPEAFKNETLTSLNEILRTFLGHENFSVLIIRSKTIASQELPDNPVLSYERSKHGVEATIAERKGYDGDGTNNFRGDTIPWQCVLTKFFSEESQR